MLKWFANLKVAHKLMLMGIFFLLPDSIMLCMVLSGINDNIEFTQQEIKGDAYLRPLVHLLHLLPEHERLARSMVAGNAASAVQLAGIEKQIDQSLTSLQAVDRQYGQALQFDAVALALRGRSQALPAYLLADWRQLHSSPPVQRAGAASGAASEVDQRMLASVRVMITHAGDMSNLILDPDLATYYLMDAVLLSIPLDQDQLARAIESGESTLLMQASAQPARGATGADLSALSEMHATLLKSDLDHVSNSVNTSLREVSDQYGTTPDLQRLMPPALDLYAQAMKRFLNLIKNMNAVSGSVAIAPAAYLTAGKEARDAGFALWVVSSQQLDGLLQLRIDYFRRRRVMSLMITASAFLAASLLATFINGSINRPLRRQAAQLQLLNSALNAEVSEKLAMQSALLEASHRAGMAEIAIGVLHNVGNVLNSVNTSATVVREKLDQSRIPSLSKVAAMIQEHRADVASFFAQDDRGKQIPDLLTCLADVMAGDRDQISEEITQLARNIEHIKQIVRSQQTFAKGEGQTEEFSLPELIEDALRMTGLSRDANGITLDRGFQECGDAVICRHKVLQIMVNLISNSRKAVMENGSPEKRIILSLEQVQDAHGPRARIRVADNGVGIPAENLERIFQHGFTTRKDGHGFGLHTSVLDAHEMGGSITVCSAGAGTGAIFVLEIPLAQPEALSIGTT